MKSTLELETKVREDFTVLKYGEAYILKAARWVYLLSLLEC